MQKFEIIKFKYQYYKDRVLFFSAMFAGSFAGLSSESKLIFYSCIVGLWYSGVGVVKNIIKSAKLIKEIDND
jgi:hypothetical protein